MPIRPPALDERSFDDLVNELLARIPAHTPEWTHPRLGDPGRTLVDLFAWLADTLLYRANLIPERQRLVFLRLLGIAMQPAIAARGLVTVSWSDEAMTEAETLQPQAIVKGTGAATFETLTELTVLPITAQGYYKRPLREAERTELDEVLLGLQHVYKLDEAPIPYVTTPVFPNGAPVPEGFDVMQETVDKCLWLALLASKAELVQQVQETLGASQGGHQPLLSVGIVPAMKVPALFEDVGRRAQIPHTWEISSVNAQGEIAYHALRRLADSTAGLTQRGVQRLELPAAQFLGAPSNDVRTDFNAGVGDRPPRLDDTEIAGRLVVWLRLRPTPSATVPLYSLPLGWVGVNAVEIDQYQTITDRVVGQSDGSADQEMQLPGASIEAQSLSIQVAEPDQGYRTWQCVDHLALLTRDATSRDAAVYSLDNEAGTIRFGDGVRGRIPEAGSRIHVARMRAGGGEGGNLPPGTLTEISARDVRGSLVAGLKVVQPVPTSGGRNAEQLEDAEQRIPALFYHHDRAVTAEDYRRLADDTPAGRLGRVEVLPRFKPQQRLSNVPGVVSVMVWPPKKTTSAPNPRPDRPLLETVHTFLELRRPLGTELYVIGCEYIPLGVSVSITVDNGFGRDTVLNAVREALCHALWPLRPHGPYGEGWPLGRAVRDRELEVAVARVPGVNSIIDPGINLFTRDNNDWRLLPRVNPYALVEIPLQPWQLPELLTVIVVTDEAPPQHLRGAPNPFASQAAVAVPVVPEVCY
jgi:predicted phage baseplate assembly protein